MQATLTSNFPAANQPQIVRASQRDIFHVAELREQAETVFRSWFGTRKLSLWDKELEFLVTLIYYGLTTARGYQTLGEEYTNIWQLSRGSGHFLKIWERLSLTLLSALPTYLLQRSESRLSAQNSDRKILLRRILNTLSILSEINLAVFYLRGTYHDITRRMLSIIRISGTPPDQLAPAPSYSLLGILLGMRLLHRLFNRLRRLQSDTTKTTSSPVRHTNTVSHKYESYIDFTPVSTLTIRATDETSVGPTEDPFTILNVSSIPQELRKSRICTLCLEERTASCVTDCGHLFCWNCIVDWGREKSECPLCRQSLSVSSLLPIYNL